MLLIAALKTKTALGGATTRTTLPITDADQDICNYFAAQEDAIRGVIDRAVSTDVYVDINNNFCKSSCELQVSVQVKLYAQRSCYRASKIWMCNTFFAKVVMNCRFQYRSNFMYKGHNVQVKLFAQRSNCIHIGHNPNPL